MRYLEKGDRIIYKGKSTDLLTHGRKYKVIVDVVKYITIFGGMGIAIKDDCGDIHYITESFFKDNFLKV